MTEEKRTELLPRVKCNACREYLIAFQGHYMHIQQPCSGLQDYINFEAYYADFQANQKFVELYGKPSLDDYDRLAILESQLIESKKCLESMISENVIFKKRLAILPVRMLIKFISFFHHSR